MVTGHESLVVCSYTWLRESPQPVEISRVRNIGHLLAEHGSMYSDMLDPNFTDYLDQAAVINNTTHAMTAGGIWLAIVANNRKHEVLTAQLASAVDKGMQVVLGCQDDYAEDVPQFEKHAVANGRVFYWGNDQELVESIEDVLLPMCDNRRNDFDTIWTDQRKTA